MANPMPQVGVHSFGSSFTQLLLIRHGESAPVVPGAPGSDDAPLSDLGREQATKLADRLAAKHLAAVYSSPLTRAIDTARALAQPRGLRVVVIPDLREVELGEWAEGGFRRRAADRAPEFLAFVDGGRWEAIPGAETDDALRARATRAIDSIVAAHPAAAVAVVCHGGFIQAYLAAVFGMHRSLWTLIENTSVTSVLAPDGERVVATVNDCHHLYDSALTGGPVG
ncbi:MAG: histidine phosphatase family protein [Acidimicrobiales bacterium]